jgi:hypothetical protein
MRTMPINSKGIGIDSDIDEGDHWRLSYGEVRQCATQKTRRAAGQTGRREL